MKVELNKWYSISEIALLRLLPVNNNREHWSKLINKDIDGANMLKTEKIRWNIPGKYTYRILGENLIKYIAMRGWDNDNTTNT